MASNIEQDSVSGRETTGHSWDGIKELNTPLPSWWLYTFYACIAFALVWVVLSGAADDRRHRRHRLDRARRIAG